MQVEENIDIKALKQQTTLDGERPVLSEGEKGTVKRVQSYR